MQLAFDSIGLPSCRHCGLQARAVICHPCRTGSHLDHHDGVWCFANPTIAPDPTICTCGCRG